MSRSIPVIEIKAKAFFDLLKKRETSMWTIFAGMLKKEEQLIIFLDEAGKEITRYQLPTTKKRLEEDQKQFAEVFKQRLSEHLN